MCISHHSLTNERARLEREPRGPSPVPLLCFLGVALAAGLVPQRVTFGQTPQRPNFVIMIADDMAWDDCVPFGNDAVRTPNLTRLATEGMRFNNAFLTISSCSPSRASIITGRYPHRTGAEQLHWPLPAEQTTFVELLKDAGYWTAAAGKWHLGDAVRDRFDEIRDVDTSGFQLPAGAAGQKGRFVEKKHGPEQSGCVQWVPLLKSRPRDKPSCLWLAALDPHRDYHRNSIPQPHRPDQVRVAPYHADTPKVRADYALYYDEIGRLDQYVGQVLDELERQDAARNTVVIFFSDNGRPFPRDKTTLYDSGIKTPLIVRWPGRIRPASTTDSLVSTVDLAPTLVELAGVPSGESFDGKSFSKVLLNPAKSVRSYAFAEKNWHDFEDHARAVRTERYKYIRNFYADLPNTPPADAVRSPTYQEMLRLRAENRLTPPQMACFVAPRPPEELYDVLSDPHEMTNLVHDAGYRDVLTELRRSLDQWRTRTDDRVPTFRTADEFDRETGKPTAARVRPRWSKKRMTEAGLVPNGRYHDAHSE